MHPLLLAAALPVMLASPAAAQSVDTARIELKDDGSEVTCRFRSFPALILLSGTPFAGAKPAARWEGTATSANGDTAQTGWAFGEDSGSDRLGFFALGFQMPALGNADWASGVTARLRFDGRESQASLSSRVIHTHLAVWVDHDVAAVGAKIQAAEVAELEIRNQTGDVRHYRWDLHRFRPIQDVLDAVHWDCKAPDGQ